MENTARNPTTKRKFSITKSDEDQRIVFGWANVSMRIGDELIEDWQEDIIEPDELETAAYDFVDKYDPPNLEGRSTNQTFLPLMLWLIWLPPSAGLPR